MCHTVAMTKSAFLLESGSLHAVQQFLFCTFSVTCDVFPSNEIKHLNFYEKLDPLLILFSDMFSNAGLASS